MTIERSEVDIFVQDIYPEAIDTIIAFIDQAQDAGQIETIDDLRRHLGDLSDTCKKLRNSPDN